MHQIEPVWLKCRLWKCMRVCVCVLEIWRRKKKKSIIFDAFIVTGFGSGPLCKEFHLQSAS